MGAVSSAVPCAGVDVDQPTLREPHPSFPMVAPGSTWARPDRAITGDQPALTWIRPGRHDFLSER